MILRPDPRRRFRVQDSETRKRDDERIHLGREVHLPRARRAGVPAVVVVLLGFLAGAIALQSFWGGLLGALAAVLIRGLLERRL